MVIVCLLPTPPVVGIETGAVRALARAPGTVPPAAISVKKSSVAGPFEEYWRLISFISFTLRNAIQCRPYQAPGAIGRVYQNSLVGFAPSRYTPMGRMRTR